MYIITEGFEELCHNFSVSGIVKTSRAYIYIERTLYLLKRTKRRKNPLLVFISLCFLFLKIHLFASSLELERPDIRWMPHSYVCTPSIITIFSPNLPPHSSPQCPPSMLFVLLIPSLPASVLRVRHRISKVFCILNDILCVPPHKADSAPGILYLYTTGKISASTWHIFEIIKSRC